MTGPARKIIASLLAALLLFPPPAWTAAPALSAKTLAKDMAYYRNLARAKKMGTNDRLYVLYRLKDKYGDSKADLKPLLSEITAWEDAKRTGVLPPLEAPRAKTRAAKKRPAPTKKPAAKAAAPAPAAAGGAPPADNTVFVMGRVKTPGGSPYREGISVSGVIASADGLLDDADRAVLVHRGPAGGRQSYTVNVPREDMPLQPGDVVEVRGRGPSVSILGMVARPGTYAAREGRTVLDLLSEAGGPLPEARTSRSFLYRQSVDGRATTPINLDDILAGRSAEDLRPGDILMVPRKSGLFGDGGPAPWLALAALALGIIAVSKK